MAGTFCYFRIKMETNTYTAIGLMSGTSLDGLDLAYVRFTHTGSGWDFTLVQAASIAYDAAWQKALAEAIRYTPAEIETLDIKYGQWLGMQTKKFIRRYGLQPDLIASHGHTVFHQPEKGVTLQIGAGQEIANATGYKVVCNFRQQDVALGGQGAPLVPIGDELLFGAYAACINMGGIANISFRLKGKRVAFDIGMANMLLNYLANQVGQPYDEAGELARGGRVDAALLGQLNNLEYYQLPYPKSTGYEWFLAEVQPLVDNNALAVHDKLATAVEHEAFQVGRVLTQYSPGPGKVLLTGGGAYNTYFVERLQAHIPPGLTIEVPEKALIEFKEAIVFALMGVLRLRGETNCLQSVTGARRDVSGGDIYEPL